MVTAPVIAATAFLWLGLVVGISFIEAPLKFRAPGVTLPIGLGIGRLVCRALNAVEVGLLAVVVVGLAVGPRPGALLAAAGVVAAALAVQLVGVRPVLTRRSNRVLAGETAPRSRAHHAYVVCELVKAAGLGTAGVLALGAA
jgi:hypothetical protein